MRGQQVSLMKSPGLQIHTVNTLSEGCWQHQTDFADSGPSDLPWTQGSRQSRAQQLIKPGLMALTWSHNPKEQSSRKKKGQRSYKIRARQTRCGMLGMVPSLYWLSNRWNSVNQDFSKFFPLKICFSLHLKLAKFESATFCDLSPQLKAITSYF